MKWTGVPPLASLRAFEAAGRNLNYSAAGRELNVSHAAIAQQVKSLENHLDLRLAARSGKGIELTPEGVFLLEHLTRGFEDIADGLSSLSQAEAERPVHVTMTPSFAANWFMPRMQSFRAVHPDIDLTVNPTVDLVDLRKTQCDVAIRFGAADWSGLESRLLLPSHFVIVGVPDLVPDDWQGRPEDFLKLPWLEDLGSDEVGHWMEDQGIEMPSTTHVTRLPGYMMLTALRNGQGVAATARVLIEEDIADGRLVILYETSKASASGYHLVWRPGIQRPAVKDFVRWIRREARDQGEAA